MSQVARVFPDYPAAQPHGKNAYNLFSSTLWKIIQNFECKHMIKLKKYFSNLYKLCIYGIFKFIYGEINSVTNIKDTKYIIEKVRRSDKEYKIYYYKCSLYMTEYTI